MSVFIRALARCVAVLGLALSFHAVAQQPITLHGAVQFDDTHPFTKSLVRFEELVKKYYGKP
ncbi:MAG: C4-dicarboxylate ABC transporter substrate-binding protein, partial [Betaproteobacteria bacterium]